MFICHGYAPFMAKRGIVRHISVVKSSKTSSNLRHFTTADFNTDSTIIAGIKTEAPHWKPLYCNYITISEILLSVR